MKMASPTSGGFPHSRVQGRLQAENRDGGGIMDGLSLFARPGDGERNTNQGVLRTRDSSDAVGTKSNRGKYGERRLRIEVTKAQLGTVTYDILPYLKPIPGTVRGLVHAIETETSERELMELLSAKGHDIMHARMLGKSHSALLTSQGPHVPFSVKVGSAYTRCRPHRRSVQYCRDCGEVGHRQDACPHPDTNKCPRCGEKVEWSRLEETLGSYHHIVQTQIQHHGAPTRLGHAKITDWPTFRKEEVARELADIEEWTQKVTAVVTKHTKTIQLTTDNPEVNPHLLHMWEAWQGLLRRWKRQKMNKKTQGQDRTDHKAGGEIRRKTGEAKLEPCVQSAAGDFEQ
ncbi:hypothetical protein IscW_ISCW018556 [Ixodes scapularis]|uniref:CCHC-type domain-containing protein n=1 Tax=Ixodes scapularis TaxID=6945 RepID=B7PPM7_IXOSC|nr:hypothetical protein IscW_ISCW018556 [Ixodes scapularis]|eukprot:XP_002435719.1 hypothetical protein IscW_ISCW018556 [Ixodes scapularis]